MSLLGKEKVSLGSSGQVRHAVTSVQEGRALISRQGSIWLDLKGFVMTEVATVLSGKPELFRRKIHTCRRGT